ncbi:MAG: hypothetical protein IMX01_02510 [Limnochordaceae bacterium]|nr:hypothetical protein [Limnochordaceae bacterium]
MRNLDQHHQTLKHALAGLSDQERAAIEALTQRLKTTPDRPTREDSDEELMRKAANMFQQLSPAEQALLAQLGHSFQMVLAGGATGGKPTPIPTPPPSESVEPAAPAAAPPPEPAGPAGPPSSSQPV